MKKRVGDPKHPEGRNRAHDGLRREWVGGKEKQTILEKGKNSNFPTAHERKLQSGRVIGRKSGGRVALCT